MLTSELIDHLEEIRKQHGDLPIYIFTDGTGPSTCMDLERVDVGEAWFANSPETVRSAVILSLYGVD